MTQANRDLDRAVAQAVFGGPRTSGFSPSTDFADALSTFDRINGELPAGLPRLQRVADDRWEVVGKGYGDGPTLCHAICNSILHALGAD